jgi:phosphatidate phosphatase PAH1
VPGKIGGKRRHEQLLDGLTEKSRYWNLKQEALWSWLWKEPVDLSQDKVMNA